MRKVVLFFVLAVMVMASSASAGEDTYDGFYLGAGLIYNGISGDFYWMPGPAGMRKSDTTSDGSHSKRIFSSRTMKARLPAMIIR